MYHREDDNENAAFSQVQYLSYCTPFTDSFIDIRAWISQYIYCLICDVIIHPCFNCNSSLPEPLLKTSGLANLCS